MLRHRVEMSASIIFDVVMPEGATDQEIKAQGAMDYRNAIKTWSEKFILYCGLPDCRVYGSVLSTPLSKYGLIRRLCFQLLKY
jgi:hypothetical protein